MDFAAPLDVAVEEFSEWDVERSGWRGELPQIDGMSVVDDLSAYIERKLFTLNSGHAICAYLRLPAWPSHDPRQRERSGHWSDRVPRDAAERRGAGEKILDGRAETSGVHRPHFCPNFHNPYLQDEVARVGREPIRKLAASDRLINPLLTAYNFGMKVDQLIFGAAARTALRQCGRSAGAWSCKRRSRNRGPPLRWSSIPVWPRIIRCPRGSLTSTAPSRSKQNESPLMW